MINTCQSSALFDRQTGPTCQESQFGQQTVCGYFPIVKVSSIRTPMLTQRRLERMDINSTHFKWDVTQTHGNQ